MGVSVIGSGSGNAEVPPGDIGKEPEAQGAGCLRVNTPPGLGAPCGRGRPGQASARPVSLRPGLPGAQGFGLSYVSEASLRTRPLLWALGVAAMALSCAVGSQESLQTRRGRAPEV